MDEHLVSPSRGHRAVRLVSFANGARGPAQRTACAAKRFLAAVGVTLVAAGCGAASPQLHGGANAGAPSAATSTVSGNTVDPSKLLLTSADAGQATRSAVTSVDLTEPEFGCRNIPYTSSKGQARGALATFTNATAGTATAPFLKLVDSAVAFPSTDSASRYVAYVQQCLGSLAKTTTVVQMPGPLGSEALAYRATEGQLHDLLITWRSSSVVGLLVMTGSSDPSATSAYTLAQRQQGYFTTAAG